MMPYSFLLMVLSTTLLSCNSCKKQAKTTTTLQIGLAPDDSIPNENAPKVETNEALITAIRRNAPSLLLTEDYQSYTDDKTLGMVAVAQAGWLLYALSERLRSDFEIV